MSDISSAVTEATKFASVDSFSSSADTDSVSVCAAASDTAAPSGSLRGECVSLRSSAINTFLTSASASSSDRVVSPSAQCPFVPAEYFDLEDLQRALQCAYREDKAADTSLVAPLTADSSSASASAASDTVEIHRRVVVHQGSVRVRPAIVPYLSPMRAVALQPAPACYFWCTCGRSRSQPYCDGSHKLEAGDWAPLRFSVKKQQSFHLLCGCKYTATPPFCDGSHIRVINGWEEEQQEKREKEDKEKCRTEQQTQHKI